MADFSLPTLIDELKRDEGVRAKPYRDTVGKLTVGVGRNLDDVGLFPDEIELLLKNDISRVCADLDRELPWWREQDPVRQRALVNMAFNMGIKGLLGFRTTLALMKMGKYLDAAQHALSSKWARQVGHRAERLALMIRDGGVS